MNPYEIVLADYRVSDRVMESRGMDGAIALVLQLMSAAYSEGYTGGSPHRYALEQLAQYEPNDLIKKMRTDWHEKISRR